MDKTVLSILLFVLGLGIGLALVFLFNFLKNKKDSNKADTIIDKAKKEAEKQAAQKMKEENGNTSEENVA